MFVLVSHVKGYLKQIKYKQFHHQYFSKYLKYQVSNKGASANEGLHNRDWN